MGVNFNVGFFFFSSKAFSRIVLSGLQSLSRMQKGVNWICFLSFQSCDEFNFRTFVSRDLASELTLIWISWCSHTREISFQNRAKNVKA